MSLPAPPQPGGLLLSALRTEREHPVDVHPASAGRVDKLMREALAASYIAGYKFEDLLYEAGLSHIAHESWRHLARHFGISLFPVTLRPPAGHRWITCSEGLASIDAAALLAKLSHCGLDARNAHGAIKMAAAAIQHGAVPESWVSVLWWEREYQRMDDQRFILPTGEERSVEEWETATGHRVKLRGGVFTISKPKRRRK